MDLEEVNNLSCMIFETTRITPNSSTVLVVIFITNTPELFRKCGVPVYDPAISDHYLVYYLHDKIYWMLIG